MIAMPTASAAAHGAGPKSLTAIRPTTVEIRCPPIKARGCAGFACGEPITRTIDVANGIAISGYEARAEKNSMAPIAIAPPAAPASTARSFGRSVMPRGLCNSRAAGDHIKKKKRAAAGWLPPATGWALSYLRLVLIVRSAERRATKRPLHQFDWLPVLIALAPPGRNTAVWSPVKALQLPLFRSV